MRRTILSFVVLCGGALFLSACVTSPGPEPAIGQLSNALVTDCNYLNPMLTTPPVIDFDRELVIRDVSVVDDLCRTSNTALGCAPGTLGVWTFLNLMTQMAGTVPVQQFAQDWLHQFEIPVTINGFTYPPPPNFRAAFLDPWVVASGCLAGDPIVGLSPCTLNLAKAPFRLLAITNRIDLSGCVGAPPGGGYDAGPGQGRFVFGFLDGLGNPLLATVIFEYEFPSSNDAFWWTAQWHALSSISMPSAAFNTTLQTITDSFDQAFLEPGKPNNGNPIGQIRTNEIAFNGIWQLREFTLQNTGGGPNAHLIRNDTNKMTPDNTLNGTTDMDGWLIPNTPDLNAMRAIVPVQFYPPSPPWGPGPFGPPFPPNGLGNACLGGASDAPFLWNQASPPLTPAWMTARHHFGLMTCNGCHALETATAFTHIDPRPASIPSNISPFLAVSNAGNGVNGLPLNFQVFNDPWTGNPLKYNEPWRRTCEVARLLAGDPCPYSRPNGAH